MTDSDDKLSKRYREAAREEPGEDLDRAILAASRRAVGAGPRARGSRWMVPASIAAVLVLGVGVSLRMQMEQPGVETSLPAGSAEYPVPPSADPAPQPPPASAQAPSPQRAPAAVPEARTAPQAAAPRAQVAPPREEPAQRDAAMSEPPVPPQPQPKLRKDAAEAQAPAEASVASPPPPAAASQAPAAPPAVAMSQAAPAAAPAPALRAKREGFAADRAAAPESRALASVADPDPLRELERIARLREAGRHDEADRALEEFRRRHPGHRIPEATWERVKPR